MDNQERYEELAHKWLEKEITPEEEREFSNWYNTGQDEPLSIPPGFAASDETLRRRMLAKINGVTGLRRKKTVTMYRRIAAVAAVLLAAFGAYFLEKNPRHPVILSKIKNSRYKNDVAPAANQAVLTLANGQRILLSKQNGLLASQGATLITRSSAGEVIYRGGAGKAAAVYNTLSVPKGTYQTLQLPDGSRVWLNAQSTLRFPAAFSGAYRQVELTGEAYFEVTANASCPFRVKTGTVLVEDIGTHFDIMAYADEGPFKTTLLEGAVRVSMNKESRVLSPGEQAVTGRNIRIETPDELDGVVAWKNNEFEFDHASLPAVLRQLQRWYDIRLEPGKLPDIHFDGTISRRSNLSEVLNMLEKTSSIRFGIDGKNVKIVTE